MVRLSVVIALAFSCSTAMGTGLFELGKEKNKNKNLVKASTSSSMINVQIAATSHGGSIAISGPDGVYLNESFEGQSVSINLLNKLDKLPSGHYTYTITSHIGNLRLVQDTIDNGRGEDNYTYSGTPITHSGSFVVNAGAIQSFAQIKEANSNEW